MKNHYVSQFIIKRFSDDINVFDLKKERIDESKRPSKIFYKDDIYTEEIEKLMCINVESRVAQLLDKKILSSDEISLTRGEVELLKTYMLLCSVRCLDEDYFAKILRGFKRNADLYISIEEQLYPSLNAMKSTSDIEISNHELYLRALKVFAVSKNIRDIALNPLATREMLAWAMPFLDSYMAFWDSSETQDFLLTDAGMCSEYEGFHQLTGGIDISKTSYLLHQIKQGKIEYAHLLACSHVMYENYNFFNLSKNRMLVMINPFFRLYHDMQVLVEDKKLILEKPDIWPAIIQEQNLFDVPKNIYRINSLFKTEDDLFVYTPKRLSKEDTIYINSITLSQTKEILGFDDSKMIIDSIYYYLYHEINYKSITKKEETAEEIFRNLMNALAASPYRKLIEYCDKKGGKNKTEIIFLFEKLLQNLFKDFYENPYICEYYLSIPEKTANCKQLDFLGVGEEKLTFFRNHLEEIMKWRKENENHR